jgi:hypothetical protein
VLHVDVSVETTRIAPGENGSASEVRNHADPGSAAWGRADKDAIRWT